LVASHRYCLSRSASSLLKLAVFIPVLHDKPERLNTSKILGRISFSATLIEGLAL
jgi:hypothetical protein